MKKVIIASLTVAVLLLACGEEEGVKPPPPGYFPADVLESVGTSFERRDIYALKKCLSPDFVFYFDPDDVGQNPPGSKYVIPESWSYDEFTDAAYNMLQMAYSISLSFGVERLRQPGENEATYKAENVTISLLVMFDEVNGITVDKGYCDFAFDRYATEQEEKSWRLIGWWDRTSFGYDEYPGASPTSFGKVLAIFA